MEIIKIRRSVRSFSDQEVSEAEVDLILRAAMQAPSARNQQANCFYLVRKKESLLKLAENLPFARMLTSANLAILVLIDKSKLTTPHMKSQDAASATTNILLEATSLGIGSCWCGVYPNEERMATIRDILKISDEYLVFSLIAIGYPKEENALHFIDRYDEGRIFRD